MSLQEISNVKDGDLIHVPPHLLLDMEGGNIRRGKRANFDEFVSSIKSQGIIQPVVARLMPDKTLQLLAGYGRRDGATPAGLETVPAIVRIVDDETAMQIHFRENFDRTELSFASQVDFARRFMSYHNDAQSAAMALSWSLTMFRERLSLVTCTEQVLTALDDGLISVKHAIVLAAFDAQVQDNTLRKLIENKWSVAELRQRADSVQIPLSKAIFNKTECENCLNNTEMQSGLFGMGEEAKCAKSSCFQAKTTAQLAVKKAEAEERYGKVLWLSQSLQIDRQTVTATVVGEQQFNTGCITCTDRVVVMDDSIVGNSGALIESQCTKKSCLTKCIAAFDDANAKAAAPDVSDTDVNVDSEKNKKPLSEKPKKNQTNTPVASIGSVSSVVVEKHQNELLAASRKHLQGYDTFKLVLHLVSIMQFTGFKSVSSLPSAMGKLMQAPVEQLERMISEVEAHALSKSTHFNSHTPAHLALTASAMSTSDGEATLIKAWQPTEDVLASYTTSAVVHLCTLSGLDKHVDAKADGSFKKMTTGKKADVIKAVLAVSDFDWSDFAPPTYLELMAKGKIGL